MRKPIIQRIKKDHYLVHVIGNKDPRGNDNEIEIYIDEEDKLIIQVGKVNRCYQFEKVIEEEHFIKVIAK